MFTFELSVFYEIPLVLALAICVHEITHYFYAKWTGDYIKIDFDDGSPTVHFDDNMTYLNQLVMYLLAIFNGAFVVTLFIIYSNHPMVHVLTLLIYLFGCKYDIIKVYELIKK